jgi:hypothetical protein
MLDPPESGGGHEMGDGGRLPPRGTLPLPVYLASNVRSLFTEGLFAIMTARTSHLEDVPLRTTQLRKQHFYRAPTHSCTMIGFYENG